MANASHVQVMWNGEKLPVGTFEDYCKLYLGDTPHVYQRLSDRWEICVAATDEQGFQQVRPPPPPPRPPPVRPLVIASPPPYCIAAGGVSAGSKKRASSYSCGRQYNASSVFGSTNAEFFAAAVINPTTLLCLSILGAGQLC